ncbi:MAG: hypothetical protein JNK63_04995 [Chthonomonas sp.]|nr:hypothetical protein [Chthonomonas sp.]
MTLALPLLIVAQTGRTYGAPVLMATITNQVINESSGIAPSRRYPGEYYTHNDSGDSARFFRVGPSGDIRGTYSLKGVQARDWEDMASAQIDGKNYLYFGDIGDNNSQYSSVFIYRVEEPTGAGNQEIANFQKYEVTYPGGARNAETLMVDPKTGDIWIVEKKTGSGSIYRLRKPGKSGKYKFERRGSISFPDGLAPMRVITGGAVAPDGKHLVMRTYAFAYEFPIPGKGMESFLETTCSRIQTPPQVQGEAITYALDSNRLVTTSEGTPCAVWGITAQ